MPHADAWRYNAGTRVLTAGDNRVGFSRREGEIVSLLVAAEGQPVLRESFIRSLWGIEEPTDAAKVVHVHICRIRRKLRSAGLGRAIENVWGRGYRWLPPTVCTGSNGALMVGSAWAGKLRSLLAAHHDRDLADELRRAIFGV